MVLFSETKGDRALGACQLYRAQRFRISGGKPLRPLLFTFVKHSLGLGAKYFPFNSNAQFNEFSHCLSKCRINILLASDRISTNVHANKNEKKNVILSVPGPCADAAL
jgi:hypothetical protein